jgi:L-iditol 2-dehydrogenase
MKMKMKMMKAAVLVANEDVRYMDYEEPLIQPGTVKVKVVVSGICGSDVPRVLHNGAHFYPIVLGHEFSGEVVEIGEGVSSVKVGDRVAGVPLIPCMQCESCLKGNFALCRNYRFIGSREQGSNAEYIVIPEKNAVVFDHSISFEQGAMFEPSTVALHGVLQNDFRGGGLTAILGGGTIGIFTSQWVKLLGSRKTVVFDINQERLELAKRLGADEVINTNESGWLEKVQAITNGKGFDYLFETAGVIPTMKLSFELASNKARICFIGTPHSDLSFSPSEWEKLNRKEFYLTGSWMSYSAPFPGKEWLMTAEYFASGKLQFDEGLVGKRFPMSQAQEAFMLYKNPGAVNGRILLINDFS